MRSQLLVILGISSTLLGVYMLLVSLLNLQQKTDFHIGCYLSDHVNDNSLQLKARFRKLESNRQYSRNLDTRVRSTGLIDSNLHRKSVDLAKNLQLYIKNLVLVNKYQQSNMQFFSQLQNARISYQNCAGYFKNNFNTQDYKSLWNRYQKCFDEYGLEKDNIQKLYDQRSKYVRQIDGILVYDPSKNANFDLQAELRKIKQKYDIENTNNDKNKERYVAELKKLHHRNQTKGNQHDENEREYQRSRLQYQICMKNLKQFRKCQDIAKALQDYGYAESVQNLQKRIRSKRQMLTQMQELVIKSRGSSQNVQIVKMYQKRQRELKQIIKLRLDMGYDEMRQCGCNQTQRQRLKSQLQRVKVRFSLNLQEINELSNMIYEYERKMKQTDHKRQELISQYRQETQKLRNRDNSNNYNLKESLEILKANLTNVNDQINQYNPRLNSLQFQCNQYKDKLSNKVVDSDKIIDCLAKKDLYVKLSSQASQILRKDDASSLEYKQKVRQILDNIQYPKAIAIQYFSEDIQDIHAHGKILTQRIRQIENKLERKLIQGNTVPGQRQQQYEEGPIKQKEDLIIRQEIVIRIEEKITISTRQL